MNWMRTDDGISCLGKSLAEIELNKVFFEVSYLPYKYMA